MPYKDREQQRECNRQVQRNHLYREAKKRQWTTVRITRGVMDNILQLRRDGESRGEVVLLAVRRALEARRAEH